MVRRSPLHLLVVEPMTLSATEAQRLADHHLVDRYDRVQLAALDRVDRLDKTGTPLVVPRGINRVYRTEPTSTPTRLAIAGPEFQFTRTTVLTLLDLGLIHSDHLIALAAEPSRRRRPGMGRAEVSEEQRAYVLTATRQGRDVLDVAHRLGRLTRRHDRKATP
jgi:hypothetical protein